MRTSTTRTLILAAAILATTGIASARPGGNMTFKRGFFWHTATVQGATGKTTWTMQRQARGAGPWLPTTYGGAVNAAGDSSDSGLNTGTPPFAADRVRAVFNNGSTTFSNLVALGNVNIDPGSIICGIGTPQSFAFDVTVSQNFLENLDIGTAHLVAGSALTISLPESFSWASMPNAISTDSNDFTVGAPSVSGRDLTIDILTNGLSNPLAGFALANSMVAYDGSDPGVGLPSFTISGMVEVDGSTSSFTVDWAPVLVPAPGVASSLLALSGLATVRRRRSAAPRS